MTLNLPSIDQPAPDFKTFNQNNELISLSQLRGKKIVLYFYPKAMTPGCTTQACGLRDHQDDFKERNTLVFGISPDAPERLKKFIERDALNFDLLSDESTEIAQTYGVWGLKKFMGREYEGIHRITFIIDEEGILRAIMSKVKTKTHDQEVLDLIDSLS